MNAQQLKSSILQYAFKGSLVKQNCKKAVVERFLESINEEKEVLIKAASLKRVKIHPVDLQSRLWDIPDNWMWSRMGEVLDIRDGTHDTPKYVNEGIPLVTSKNLRNNDLDFGNIKYISEKDHLEIEKRSKVDSDDILFAMIGTIGNPVLVKKNREFSVKNIGIFKAFPKNKMYMEYVYYYLDYMSPILKKEASGGVQSFVSLSRLRNIPIPIPPLEEQERIVNKIKILEEKVSTYNKLYNRIEVTQAKFPIDLEKSILQYAMQGKLVSQYTTDEPASALLEKIRKEKEELVEQKIIKKEKDLPQITEEEIPFKIPTSWEWIRMGDLNHIIMGQSPKGESVSNMSSGIEFHQGKTNFTKKIISKAETFTSAPAKIAPANSLVMSVRAPVGDINITDREICIGRGLCSIKPLANVSLDYMYYMLLMFKPVFERQATGSTFKAITGSILKNQIFPLPPLEEQKRIVSKIEDLLSVVNELNV